MAVNAEGEPAGEFANLSRAELEQLAVEAAKTIDRLQGEANALVNALTAIVIVYGSPVSLHIDLLGTELQLPPADMDRIGGHYFTMAQDPATKVITLRAQKRGSGNSAALALTAAQELDNRRAGEVALSKDRLIKPPSGIIIP